MLMNAFILCKKFSFKKEFENTKCSMLISETTKKTAISNEKLCCKEEKSCLLWLKILITQGL